MLQFLLTLAGSSALLLWGVHLVQSGMQQAFGGRLRAALSAALNHPLKAFASGVTVTAALQSSTATGLMVTSFVGRGLVSLRPALAVMLGANVGSTLIVQVLVFPVMILVPVLAIAGFVLLRRSHSAAREVGGALLGLTLVMLALDHLTANIGPHLNSPVMQLVLNQLSEQPVVAVVVAALFTWAAHASVAIVLLVMSFAAQEAISLSLAFALVLGANLGTALNPLFEGVGARDRTARRLPMGNLMIRAVGIALALPLLDALAAYVSGLATSVPRAVALFHTVFNLALAIVFLPALTPYSRLLERWMSARADEVDPSAPLYLSAHGQDAPVIALARAARETLRLTDSLERMLLGLRRAFDHGEHEQIRQAQSLDDVLDRLNGAIKTHVTMLDRGIMNEADQRRAAQILAFATQLEQAGDLIDSRLLSLASKRVTRGLEFSPEGRAELSELIDRVQGNVRSAANVFMSGDVRAARLLAQEKEAVRQIVASAAERHFMRLRNGRISSIETSALHLDMLHLLKQVNSHLVEGAAYPLLEDAGVLLPSRLRPESGSDPSPPQMPGNPRDASALPC